MDKKMTICFIGCGRFAKFFVPLFKAHPVVEKVYVCDLIRERAEQYSKDYDVEIIESFEDALASEEINAVAIFTPRTTHGPNVIKALKAGKHVYSAVPGATKIEEFYEIERLADLLHGRNRLLPSPRNLLPPGIRQGYLRQVRLR